MTSDARQPGHPHRAHDVDVFGKPPKGRSDWSHRRGEPRVFAFCWTLYLLAATVIAFSSAGAAGAGNADAFRPAARGLLAACLAGISLLWPMTRLSQMRPGPRRWSAVRCVLEDIAVLVVPAQAVIWPQVLMASWPVSVVGALACSTLAWALALGALLYAAFTSRRRAGVWWMAIFVAIAGAGPLLALVPGVLERGAEARCAWWWMTSPVTSGFELTRDRPWSGASAWVSLGHWVSIGVVGAISLVGWALVLGHALTGETRPDPA